MKERKLIIDAKYRKPWENVVSNNYYWKNDFIRGDVFQVVSYKYLLNCELCGVAVPVSKKYNKEYDIICSYDLYNDNHGDFIIVPYCNEYDEQESYIDYKT